jgi:hypothetical protein
LVPPGGAAAAAAARHAPRAPPRRPPPAGRPSMLMAKALVRNAPPRWHGALGERARALSPSGSGVLLLLLIAAVTSSHSFDPEWLRPRYHYGNGRLLGNYGGGDVTDAIFLDGAWFVGADCQPEGHCFHKSADLVHWRPVPRKSKGQLVYDTGGLTIDDDGTPVGFAPSSDGYGAHVATDHTLEEWQSLGTVVRQDEQTPWLPVHNASLCNPAYGQGDGYEYMDTVAPWKASDGLWHLVAPIQGCEDRLRGVATNPTGNEAQALLFTSPALRGPHMNWTYAGVFFKTNETVVPGRTPWVDFIDSDCEDG